MRICTILYRIVSTNPQRFYSGADEGGGPKRKPADPGSPGSAILMEVVLVIVDCTDTWNVMHVVTYRQC